MAAFDDQLRLDLDALQRDRRHRTVRVVADGAIDFSSNDYLGLARAPELAAAIATGLRDTPTGAAASRLISGTHDAHVRAERALAELVGLESALLFSSGYAANVGLVTALAGTDDLIVSDALNHASLIDGARLSRARVVITPHADPDAVRAALLEHRASARRAFVLTESVFSMDGDTPDLLSLRRIANELEAALVVDEAHALGVFGGGRGVCAELGVRPDVLVGTLGKSFGLMGAFVAGSPALTELLANRARSFVFSTGLSPIIAAAVPTALSLATDDRRALTLRHARRIRSHAREHGFDTRGSDSAIVPILLGAEQAALDASQLFASRGLFVHPIRPPTVPRETSRLRLVATAAHGDAEVDRLLDGLRELASRR